jgi:hypothetical protein
MTWLFEQLQRLARRLVDWWADWFLWVVDVFVGACVFVFLWLVDLMPEGFAELAQTAGVRTFFESLQYVGLVIDMAVVGAVGGICVAWILGLTLFRFLLSLIPGVA